MKPAHPSATAALPAGSPFDLEDQAAYSAWREARLAAAPGTLDDLIVEIGDPRRLSDAECEAIRTGCRRANMAIYVGTTGDDPDKTIPARLGERFGLRRLDHNRGADEDAITSLMVQGDARHAGYIPYTNRAIAWHTDGYYNDAEHQIHGLILHCVHPAEAGGENALLDPEIAYIRVRDQDPEHIRALMHPECMTIPANPADGPGGGDGQADASPRPDRPGPVFSFSPDGHLHMRYTDRSRSIRWRNDPLTVAAVTTLKSVLRESSPSHFLGRLESGWGLICNNVLHTRTGFSDGAVPRLLYRARYYDRIAGT
ncbi:MAG: TauD/TfdA family dioxygenase [Bdellovibrio bacteriovorus]